MVEISSPPKKGIFAEATDREASASSSSSTGTVELTVMSSGRREQEAKASGEGCAAAWPTESINPIGK